MPDGGFDIPHAIITTAGQYGVDPDFALSIAHAESGLDPSATSPKGALGVFQLMPKTAEGLGVDPHDVHQNIIGGVKYLKSLSDRYDGDHRLVAAAYNAGPGAVDKHGGVPPFAETQAYVDKVAGPEEKPPPVADVIARANLPNLPGYVTDPSYKPPPGQEDNPAWQAPAVPLGGPEDAPPSLADVLKRAGAPGLDVPKPGPAPIVPTDALGNVTGLMANFNRAIGIGDDMAAGFRTAGHALTGLPLNQIPQDFAANLGRQRQLEAGFQQAHPIAADLARGTGMAALAAIPGPDVAQAFAQGSRVTNALRGVTLAGLTSAGYGAVDAGTPGERVQAATDAATPWKNPLGFALGAVTGGASAGAPRAAAATTHASTLAEAGVPLTMGQYGGALAHRFEDVAESLPMTGAMIKARKADSLRGFDRAAINEALSPIAKQVTATGREAIAQANQHVSNAYNTALDSVRAVPDQAYLRDLMAITSDAKLPASVRNDVSDIVKEFVTDPLAGDTSGASWKRVDSDLNTLIRSADNGAGSSPQSLSLRNVLRRVQDAHWDLLERQNPQASEGVTAADSANAAMERVRAAAATPATATREGIFTASDLNRAVASKGGRSGRRAYGEGGALLQNLSDAGQAVLPSTVPDSGTALRAVLTRLGAGGGALAGIGAVGGHAVAVPAAIGSLAADMGGSLLYTRPVQSALRNVYLSRLQGGPSAGLPGSVAARASVGSGAVTASEYLRSKQLEQPNALTGVSLGR
jgi:hypothetical protein